MFCPKCGSEIKDGSTICDECNYNIEPDISSNIRMGVGLGSDLKQSVVSKVVTPNFMIFTIIGIVVLVMFFIGANYISDGGSKIMSIQSVAGNSIEEAYYNDLGSIYAGYALIVRALGIFFSSLLVWLGLRN